MTDKNKTAGGKSPTPYQRIMRASKRGTGLRLTADEVWALSKGMTDKTVGGRIDALARELAEIADETLSSEGAPEVYELEMATLRERFKSQLLLAFDSRGLRDGLERAAAGRQLVSGCNRCGRPTWYGEDGTCAECALLARAESSKLDGERADHFVEVDNMVGGGTTAQTWPPLPCSTCGTPSWVEAPAWPEPPAEEKAK
jgi:hypothetical protein